MNQVAYFSYLIGFSLLHFSLLIPLVLIVKWPDIDKVEQTNDVGCITQAKDLRFGLIAYVMYHVICGMVTLYREMNYGHIDQMLQVVQFLEVFVCLSLAVVCQFVALQHLLVLK